MCVKKARAQLGARTVAQLTSHTETGDLLIRAAAEQKRHVLSFERKFLFQFPFL